MTNAITRIMAAWTSPSGSAFRQRLSTRQRLWLWVVVIPIVFASACSSPSGASSPDTSLEGRSPLQAQLGLITDPVEYAVSVRDELTARADLVAECMRSQGFEYVAWVAPDFAIVDTEATLPAEDYVHKYGYGISTRPDLYSQVLDYPADPNIEIQQHLTSEESAAYMRALDGSVASEDNAFEVLEPGGCMKEAEDAVTPANAAPPEALDRYFTAKSALEDRIAADQRVVNAVEGWQTCMSGRGYSFTDPPDAINSVYERWAELVPNPDPAIATPQMASVLSRSELSAYVDPSFFDQLVAYEMRVAGDDFACQADYREVESEVRNELETEFVKNNRELLETVKPSLR